MHDRPTSAHDAVPIADVLDLMVRVSRATAFRLQGPRPAEFGVVEAYAVALHVRCHSLLGAAHLLLREGYVHEAAIMGRPLFSDSLLLAELAASDPITQGSLVVGMSLDGIARHEKYLRAREDEGVDVTAERKRLEEGRRGEERLAREHGYSTKHREPDERLDLLAARHGRSSEYSTLLLTHQFVHGATGVVLDRVGRDGEKAVIGTHIAQAKPWVRDFGIFVARSMLHAARALYALLGWTRPPELDALLVEVGLPSSGT
jgi:hypothetical protein